MLTFLKQLGVILAKGTAIVTGLAPFFPNQSSKVQRIKDTLEDIVNIIVNVETFGAVLGTPGPDKLKAAAPLVAQVILQTDLMAGKKVNDPVKFALGVSKITEGMVDILNSLKDNVESDG